MDYNPIQWTINQLKLTLVSKTKYLNVRCLVIFFEPGHKVFPQNKRFMEVPSC